ncbi:MAG: MBL fold metallo-hydrolase [Hyphomonas sp.]
MTDTRIILLGTGSSGGVPRVGGDWGTCDPEEPRNRRRRCCALIQKRALDDQLTNILIDTSPDLREQLLGAQVKHLDAVIYTHDHADQSHGIDDVRALAIRQRSSIPVYFDPYARGSLMARFEYCFTGGKGYPAILSPHHTVLEGRAFAVQGPGGPVEFLPVTMVHGAIPCTGYRIGNVAYCNDVNELPEAAMRRLGDLDVLIIDALRYAPHPSHAHLDLALEWISRLKPKKAVLTNLHVDMDYQTLCKTLPANVEPGYDGMEIQVSA